MNSINLNEANLIKTDFRGTSFVFTKLIQVDIRGNNLTGAS